MLEVAAHDHFQDLRYYSEKSGETYRNLLLASGISPNKGQLPGFNTFTIDLEEGVAKDLVLTSIDITKAYGSDELPPLSEVQTIRIDY